MRRTRASGSGAAGRAWTALALLLLAAPLARGGEVKVEAQVVSRREQRVHLQLKTPFAATQARLAANQKVALQVGGGAPVEGRLVAASSRYLVVEVAGGVTLPEGALWVVGGTEEPPASLSHGGAAPAQSTVQVGRRAPTLATFRAEPQPERELVPFKGGAAPAQEPERGPGAKEGDWTDQPRVDSEGRKLTRSGRIANDVRGEVMVGADFVTDPEVDVTQTTPFARVRLEVRQVGGSDRMSFRFYGGLRRPFGGDHDDWTDESVVKENARIGALAFEIEPELPEHIRSFSDRIELSVGRDLIPRVLEAGLVDGVRVGARFGPVTPFAFGGFAVSNNPRSSDYDNLILGGGMRFEQAFSHAGALRLSLAAAHERFRGDGERDFMEAQGDVRYGAFGAVGALVLDLYDPITDKSDLRLTTGALSVYAQVSRAVRLEAGYRERRAQYQLDLLKIDLLANQVLTLDKSARRNLYAQVYLRLLDELLDLWVRGEYYESRHAREAAGGVIGAALRLNERHRVSIELSLRRRYRSQSEGRNTTDPFLLVSWLYQGESLMSQLSVGYRDSSPEGVHDRRIAFRLMLDYEIGHGFGVRGYGELDFRRDDRTGNDGVTTYLGLSARYRF
ncbi:MAG: hypothetical protein AB7N76_01845 [Planctomycetota bacterium]